jgi:hypothetical protein
MNGLHLKSLFPKDLTQTALSIRDLMETKETPLVSTPSLVEREYAWAKPLLRL